ncbi:DNA/RNA non-specific endonuclease [Sphingomonas sp. XXL09]|uniref:DNA/RNA non-specific endonuclease n=1 Tax=Sphingomonas sp. XXL09 TaxID=3457787 RepID=UPI00406BD0F0
MILVSDSERRRAFSIWLRTGRLPSIAAVDGVELKFNPWHDSETGRFTFVGAGQHYGQWGGGGFSGGGGGKGGGGGATGSGDWPARSSRPISRDSANRAISKDQTRIKRGNLAAAPQSSSHKPSAPRAWTGGGFTGGGGGSFGGAGASGTWGSHDPNRRSKNSPGSVTAVASTDRASETNRAATPPGSASSDRFRAVERNGYTYQIDARGRTRRVSGALTVTNVPIRSRASQAQAGGAERRASDDGGHYIAARFNGPTEAFNHFAQDANFNRCRYRVLENEWAREKRDGKTVTVKVVPRFEGASGRPSVIDVRWTVDGKRKSLKFPNERSERSRGKR